MSFIKFSDLLDKSFENGTIEINSLEQLLRGLVTKLNLTKSNVDMTYVEEKGENESETIICTNNFNENMQKADSSIEGDSSNFSKSSEMSIINYFNDQYNNISFETLGVKRASNIQELPALLALPPFSFSCKQKSLKTRNIDMLNKLEFHIKKHNDAVNLISSQNQFFLQQQICDIQKQLNIFEEKLKDLFFACEQNEEKTVETIQSIGDFNKKIFCLNSDVKKLINDSKILKEKIAAIESDCELKEYTSNVNEKLHNQKSLVFSTLKQYTLINDFNDECDRFKLQMESFKEIFNKFENAVKRALRCLKIQIDEKMEKDGLKKFKSTTIILFDRFISELKLIMLKMFENAPASGTTQNLSCLSCKSQVSEFIKLTTSLDNESSRFKLYINKTPVPKPNFSRVKNFCRKELKQEPKFKICKMTCNTKESLLSFPNTQQCFIVSKDNAIYKADPLKCLLNSNYTKI